ncbi:MAG: PAS domain S-box protein [Nitrospirae bacterium]|nr:PAS domain S-box protein [Nitrospirota bacterium]
MQDNTVKVFTATLFIFAGIMIGIFLAPSLPESKGVFMGFQVVLGIVIFLLVVSIYSAVRIYISSQRKMLKAAGDTREKSEMGFVVDTFHELVGKLKEKEKELERLRSLAEDRALSIESYNENILQSVPSGVVSIDNSMKVRSMNPAAERILGVSAEDAIDKDSAEIFKEPLIALIKKSEIVLRGEYPYVTSDGRHIWLGVTSSQLKDSSGGVIGRILVFTDLTEVKTLQSQVEIKKRLTQLGEMSAGIAHELRNPMSVIAGYAKLLGRKVESTSIPTVDAILREIEGMERIISELLAFTKPTDINRTPVNLKILIEGTAMSAVSGGSLINISIDADESVIINADEFLLRQALTNLFVNAVEAMPDGGTIEIKLKALHNSVEIKISDTGRGIPEDIRQKIFLPFYTTKEKGTGLGLALVQKIIVSHGGNIDVESAEGRGTAFRITLPAGSQACFRVS